MIILNDKEMKSKYTVENKILVLRNKNKDIKALYEDVLAGNDLSEYFKECYYFSPSDQVDMSSIKFKGLTMENLPDTKSGLYTKIYSEDEYLSSRAALNTYIRPDEFNNFEKFKFNQPTSYVFDKKDFPTGKELLDEVQAAAGILPTLWDLDISYEEKKALSTAGENIIRHLPQEVIAVDNPVPNIDDIKLYLSLTTQEKKLINRGRINPRQAFDLIKYIRFEGKDENGKNKYSDRLITKKFLTDLEDLNKHSKFSVREEGDLFKMAKMPEMVEKVKPLFQQKFKFVPQIINEYVEGQTYMLISPEEMTEHFNRKNIQQIAKYKSPTLFAVSHILKFGEFKENIIEALAVNIAPNQVKMLYDKGFFDYLQNHKNLSVNEVENLIDRGVSDLNPIRKYDNDKTPRELINDALNQAGAKARDLYEKSYKYKFSDNEIAIKGRHLCVQEGNKKMYILPKDDLRNFIVGDSSAGGVSCCQHYGGAGGSCVWKVTEDPFAANAIIEVNGQIAAQAFVWTDEQNKTFVFDNFEYKNDSNANGYMNLIGTFVKHIPYPNVHIGMGYTEGLAWNGVGILTNTLTKDKYAQMPRTLSDGRVYSDYHPSGSGHIARALKMDGQMVKYPVNESVCRIETKPDEPTKYDVLATDEFSFMINANASSVDERIAIVNDYINNPTDEKLETLFKTHPFAIKAFPDLSENIQKIILEEFPEYIELIRNPINEVKREIIRRDPHKLFLYENPPADLVLSALSADGLLIRHIKNPTEEMYEQAVKQNGYALFYIPKEDWTKKLKKEAIKTSPKLITKMEYDSSLLREAINVDKNVFYLINNASEEDKAYAISRNPGVINSIKEPSPALVRQAVSLNGLLIRNFQNQYPEFRTIAIEQNPFAIRALHNLTKEEAELALRINSNCEVAIKDADLRSELGLQTRSNPILDIISARNTNTEVSASNIEEFDIDIETM